MNALQISIPRILHQIGEAFLKEPLSKQMPAYQSERAQLLQVLNTFENEVLRLRQLHKKGDISVWAIAPNLREWVLYSDAHYYKNMAARYRIKRFDADADRVEAMSKHGSKRTTVTEDANGNIVSETVASGATVSNAVQVEF